MTTKQDDLIWSLDRFIAEAQGYKQNATRLAQLEGEVKRAQDTLVGLNAQNEQARKRAVELEQLEQRIRAKQTEDAELTAVIAQKQAILGKADSDMRDLRKRLSGDLCHP